jgi:hypothetical protein
MKPIVIALAAVALVAGCADLPDTVRHPFAARGATTQTDTPDVGTQAQQASPYPYNSPYGN